MTGNLDFKSPESNEEKDAYSAISKFRVIKSPKIQKILWLLLIFLLARIILDTALNGSFAIDHNAVFQLIARNTIYVAAAINFILFFRLIHSVPLALENLWDRGIIKSLSEERDAKKVGSNDKDSVSERYSQNGLDQEYCAFINEFDSKLNSIKWQTFMGAVMAAAVLSRSFFEFWSWLPRDFWMGLIYLAGGRTALIEGVKMHLWVFLTQYSLEDPLGFLSGIIFDPLLGFFLGLVTWKMLISGRYFSLINKRFKLRPIIEHPDEIGGLGCLGNIYILNASMIGIWSALFVSWLVLGRIAENENLYVPLILEMLTLFALVIPFSLLVPLWDFYKMMQKNKELIIKSLDLQISQSFSQKAYSDLKSSDIGEIERISQAYCRASRLSVWSFGKATLAGIVLSQILTYLGASVSFFKVLNLIQSVSQEISQLL